MKIIITGGTGTVGAETIRQAILDPKITEILTITRNLLDIEHPKLKKVLHQDFLDYSALVDTFKSYDACIWCLGISQTQVNAKKYYTITHDFTLAGANTMFTANPNLLFVFVSGAGADPTEQSKTLFARVKGKTENDLQKIPFKKLYIVRPAGIQPIHKNKNMAFANKLILPLFPLLKLIMPNSVITSVELAQSMLQILSNNIESGVINNKELKNLAKTL